MRWRKHQHRGFTLIELVTVLILIAVLSVSAISQFASVSVYEKRLFLDEVKQAHRYANVLAKATGCSVEVRLTSSSYTLLHDNTSPCNMSLPTFTSSSSVLRPVDLQNYTGTAPSGVSISGISSTYPLRFLPNGTVLSGTNAAITGTAVATVGGKQMVVYGATGFVK